MNKRRWKNLHPTSLRSALEACKDFARESANLSVERIAERVYAALFGEDQAEPISPQAQLVQGMAAQHAEQGLDAQQVQHLVDDLRAKTQSATRLIA